MITTLTHDGRVKLAAAIDLPMSVGRLWGEIADLPRFAAHDFFHARFTLPHGKLEQGALLKIRHSYLGVRIHRTGRILQYKPQQGYSFSDLSRRCKIAAFPHVFIYRIEPLGLRRSRLHLEVRGRWTLPILPRSLAKLWLWGIFFQIVVAVENELLCCCSSVPLIASDAGVN